MLKNKILASVAAICLFLIFTMAVIIERDNVSEADFPLEIDLVNTVFNVGDKISFNATITNKSYKVVNIITNGWQPSVVFRDINDMSNYTETTVAVHQILTANSKISRAFDWEVVEPGTYVLRVRYNMTVNNNELYGDLGDIIIEVK
ncbi:MAG: hypothetical protein FWG55_00625 [Candidatus Bathyarchaeota archaeon]|nr:hypothetical protein [Candidatus Termiticorpusculum sp.]